MKLISFIIPIYNGEHYINRCLNSILEQGNHNNIEIILINDASTDNSLKICNWYSKHYKNISIYTNNQNQGVSYSRNIGIIKADAKYIFFLDIDDFLTENSLSHMIEATQSNYDLICYPIYSNKQNKLYKYNLPLLNNISRNDLFKKNQPALYDVTISTWIKNKLYKTSIIKANNITFNPAISYSEDVIFNLSFLPHSLNYLFQDFPIIVYDRNVENSLSRKFESTLISQFFIQRKYFEQFLTNNNIPINNYFYLDSVGLLTYSVFKVLNSQSSNSSKVKELQVLLDNNPQHLLPYFNLNNNEEFAVYTFIKTQDLNVLIKE